MKFVTMLVAAACAGALIVIAVPTTLVGAASVGLQHVRLADLNPFRAVFDYERRRIQTRMTPEELGIHATSMKLSPITLAPAPLKLDLSQSFGQQAQFEIQRNNQRMEDLRNYSRDPSHWIGPPPN